MHIPTPPRREPSATLPSSLTRQPHRAALPPAAHRLLIALRAAVVIARSGADPLPRMAEMLGGAAPAREWMVLIGMIGAAWPEPVAIRPPCCGLVTHDEAAMLDLLASAGRDDRRAVDDQLSDQIDAASRESLLRAAACFMTCWKQ